MPTGEASGSRSERILITGATGGLGEALARHYAKPGATLLLWGRNPAALAAVAEACRSSGATTGTRALDLTDSAAAIAALEDDDLADPIGVAIFAAGLGDVQASGDLVEPAEQIVRLGLVNFVTPCAMAASLANRMAERRRGKVVLIGSAAAFHALPFAAAYASSKAGLSRFAQALRVGVAPYGVHVMLVSPGFIDTAAGRKVPGPKPFLMSVSTVAVRIARASARGQTHLILPWPFAALRVAVGMLPIKLRDRLLRKIAPRPTD